MNEFIIEYIQTKEKNSTVKVNDYLLHSKYNPSVEAERFVKQEVDQQYLNIVFGYGLGYIAKELEKQKFPTEKVLFIEPINGLNSYKSNVYDTVFSNRLEEFDVAIEKKLKFLSRKVKVVLSPNYEKLFGELYVALLKRVFEIQNIHIVYKNTVQKLSGTWQENIIKNIIQIHKSCSLKDIEKYYNCPVIIASGGPSLVKQLPLLEKVREQVILIAAGSTINTLLKYEIEPDYILTIDGSLSNYTVHYEHLQLTKAKLIFVPASHYKIQQNYKNRMFTFLEKKEHKFQEYMKHNYDIELPRLDGGGSVANYALTVARYISSGAIALIGQDLAYTNGQTHATGNKNNLVADKQYFLKNGAFEVEGYYGEKVITDYGLLPMKESFEYLIKELESADSVYNCTEGGVKIFGMNQMPFADFISTYVIEENQITTDNFSVQKVDYSRLHQQFRKEVAIYKQIVAELKSAQRALKSTTSKIDFSQSVLNVLDNVDIKINKLMRKVIMEVINDPITIDIMTKYEKVGDETAEESYTRVYKQNEELYDRLLKATEQTISYTHEVLEEIEKCLED